MGLRLAQQDRQPAASSGEPLGDKKNMEESMEVQHPRESSHICMEGIG
jgi:hypothetical protein